MKKKFLILEYNTGNYSSIISMLKRFDCQVDVGKSKKQINFADVIIFPGVGTFPNAMNAIKKNKLINHIRSQFKKGKHLLGICLGMQLFSELSEEILPTKGLGLISGDTKILSNTHHIGWNKVYFNKNSIFSSLNKKEFYFQHKYYLANNNLSDKGFFYLNKKKIVGMVKQKNIIGVQFHPEKSQGFGNEFFKIYLENLDD